ncbi:phenylalanine--tRNA ligase subunit beta [[Mycoplasma] gypis]|uniref:Phenylalanine--tRNA ligase beta subunit n=1 Tax=[Mycoplasma] gypis TaxID=92404 RepID=A0ABZ2RMB9_9BACT|nr:phenylalanine--tRNA ligase subunit beta [[Mycoplasma] gypis]MBN0919157.1 phenylalanine--tRNA ligase subunit beta [[Mycoplasma] gypis]
MLFSYLKLKKLANLDKSVTVEDIVKAINSIGFEVEGYEKFSDLDGIKFGKVLKTYKNPNADRLTVCEIQFADQNRVIQTNATNVKEGHYLMAFVPGSRSKNITFGAKEMKGIVSEGMLVSLEEIGFNLDYVTSQNMWNDGIFVFDQEVDLTLNPIDFFELDDYIIDVSILSNRADANSYLIMARELAAYFLSQITEITAKPNEEFRSDFKIASLENTHYFTLREAKTSDINIDIRDQLFLMKNNVKTISKPVDLSNLVLLYAGVPTHAYDVNKLASKSFEVQNYTGQVELLGKNVVNLDKALCVVNEKPVSVAAVMGLENSSCSENTENIIFEIASFNIKSVREAKKQVKLETASASRASKEISLGSIHLAHKYLASKLLKASQIINLVATEEKSFDFDNKYLDNYAGFEITATEKYQQVLKQLAILGIKIQNQKVVVPSYRYDLNSMQDFVEEVFRFYGYDNFVAIQPEIKQIENITYKDYNSLLKAAKYQNVRTFSLTSPKNNIFDPFAFKKAIKLQTFASNERTELRFSMAYAFWEILDFNAKRKIEKMSIFEVGMIHDKENVLALASNQKSFNELKEDIVNLLDCEVEFKRAFDSRFHPNVAAWIFKADKKIGYLAKIHPEIINSDAIFAEIFLDEDSAKPKAFANYKHDPLKSRDITITLKDNQDVDEILEKTKNLKGIYQVKVIDKYYKNNGEVNVTFNFLVEDWAIKKLESVFGV